MLAAAPGLVNDGRALGGDGHGAQHLLRFLEPGLCIDAGAAIGRISKRILETSPESRVIAYEPFPGNLNYLSALARAEPRIAVRPVALAQKSGTGTFNVPALVARDEQGWAKGLKGYSSLGHLGGAKGAASFAVTVARLDDEIGEHVRFLKIDVQGGEMDVLRGAEDLIDRHGIDLIQVEFNGQPDVLEFLAARGYVLFDTDYVVWPVRRYWRNWLARQPGRLPDWERIVAAQRSMGGMAAMVWPRVPARGLGAYRRWFIRTRMTRCGMQCEIVAIAPDALERIAAGLRETSATA